MTIFADKQRAGQDNPSNYRKFQPSHGALDFLGNSVVFPWENPNFYFKAANSLFKQKTPTSCKIKNNKKKKKNTQPEKFET